jgi:hypothetical protein
VDALCGKVQLPRPKGNIVEDGGGKELAFRKLKKKSNLAP